MNPRVAAFEIIQIEIGTGDDLGLIRKFAADLVLLVLGRKQVRF